MCAEQGFLITKRNINLDKKVNLSYNKGLIWGTNFPNNWSIRKKSSFQKAPFPDEPSFTKASWTRSTTQNFLNFGNGRNGFIPLRLKAYPQKQNLNTKCSKMPSLKRQAIRLRMTIKPLHGITKTQDEVSTTERRLSLALAIDDARRNSQRVWRTFAITKNHSEIVQQNIAGKG